MNISTNKAFTFLELLIVVAIIGILSATVMPAYCDYIGKAKVTETLTYTNSVKTKIDNYLKLHKKLPNQPAFALMSFSKEDMPYIESLNWHPQQATLILKITEEIAKDTNNGQYLALSLTSQLDKPLWECSNHHPLLANLNTIPDKHVPISCRQKN